MNLLILIKDFFVATFEGFYFSKKARKWVDPEKVAAARKAIENRDCPGGIGCTALHCPAMDFPISERPCSFDVTPDYVERKVQWFKNWLKENGQL